MPSKIETEPGLASSPIWKSWQSGKMKPDFVKLFFVHGPDLAKQVCNVAGIKCTANDPEGALADMLQMVSMFNSVYQKNPSILARFSGWITRDLRDKFKEIGGQLGAFEVTISLSITGIEVGLTWKLAE
jgi:hypothetical protein